MILEKGPRRTTQSEWQARWETLMRAPRAIALGLLVLLIFGVFGQRLWHLIFVQGDYYTALAEWQSTRVVDVPAPRGIIYSRDSSPLVRNVPSFKVVVIPEYLPDYSVTLVPAASPDAERQVEVTLSPETEAVLIRLAVLLDMPYTTAGADGNETESLPGIKEIVEGAIKSGSYYRPAVIKRNVERDTALLIASESLRLPGIQIDVDARREYLYGPLISQVMGYLLPIPAEEKELYEELDYDADTDRIGWSGVEATYEDTLRGHKGEQVVEEDVLGRVIRVVEERAQPTPGNNVYLTLDLDLQQVVEEALRLGMERANSPRGVALAMNPQTGEILAMVSLPTFDNNMFSRTISEEDLSRLEDPHRPMINHAIADRLQPGSTFKIVVATAALQEGVLDGQKTRLNCPGRIIVPNKYAPNDPGLATAFDCWIWRQGGSHGWLDVVGGIANSCNVFFYKVGGGFEEDDFEGLGPTRIAKYARMFGFGQPTGVELVGEAGGRVPDPTWKRKSIGESWTLGNTYLLSIGEEYLEVTPLQMLNAVNTVANGGTLYRPRIVHHVTDAEGNVIQAFESDVLSDTLSTVVTSTNWSLVQQGMEGAVAYGTAVRYFPPIEGVRVAGKTGTAQYCDDIAAEQGLCVPGLWPEHAWFTAFAPVEAPEISVIAFLYHGGEGSVYAVPVVHDIMAYYFSRDESSPQ